MKRITAVILALFYLTLASGANINIHYCGENIESIRFLDNNEICCCGINANKSECCEDELIYFDIDVDQTIGNTYNLGFEQYTFQISKQLRFELFKTEHDFSYSSSFLLPPPKPKPIWLLNCNFTFYG
jgi:hypothetical protein